MTERMHDMPTVAAGNDTELPPSADWFSRHGSHFLGAQGIVQRIGVVPDDIRSYIEAIDDDEADELIMCNMALEAVKEARGCSRFVKYGEDTDLYTISVKKLAITRLGRRATAALMRAAH
jgi:hypothetical protein